MKNNIENGIYIPEEQRNLIPVDEWVKREDPTTAQTVVLVTDFGMLEIAKEDLPGGFNFEGAQKAAAEYRKGFRCPTRHEAIEMYDARFRGLDEAFKKIGGEPATTIGWTSEADPDRSAIPTTRSSTAAARATWASTTSMARAPCVRFPLSRNSFTVQSFPRPLRGAGLTPKTKQK